MHTGISLVWHSVCMHTLQSCNCYQQSLVWEAAKGGTLVTPGVQKQCEVQTFGFVQSALGLWSLFFFSQ